MAISLHLHDHLIALNDAIVSKLWSYYLIQAGNVLRCAASSDGVAFKPTCSTCVIPDFEFVSITLNFEPDELAFGTISDFHVSFSCFELNT